MPWPYFYRVASMNVERTRFSSAMDYQIYVYIVPRCCSAISRGDLCTYKVPLNSNFASSVICVDTSEITRYERQTQYSMHPCVTWSIDIATLMLLTCHIRGYWFGGDDEITTIINSSDCSLPRWTLIRRSEIRRSVKFKNVNVDFDRFVGKD